jgi:uncharacterized cupredoxin-like copper-binding protein
VVEKFSLWNYEQFFVYKLLCTPACQRLCLEKFTVTHYLPYYRPEVSDGVLGMVSAGSKFMPKALEDVYFYYNLAMKLVNDFILNLEKNET